MNIAVLISALTAVYILLDLFTALPFGMRKHAGNSFAAGGDVLITVDDMPSEFLTHMLKLLDGYGRKAVFFVNGCRHPDKEDIKAILESGHAIGNHSFSHYFFNPMLTEIIVSDLERNRELLRGLGAETALVRTPHGYRTPGLMRYLRENGLRFMYWDMMLPDFIPLPRFVFKSLIDRFLQKGGGVICMHGRERSLYALRYLLESMGPESEEQHGI